MFDGDESLRPPRERVETGVGRDRVEPRAELASALEPAQPAPCKEKRVLKGILRVVVRPEHAVAMSMQLGAVWFDEPAERFLIAQLSSVAQLALLPVRPR
jgi:hypothetical protein